MVKHLIRPKTVYGRIVVDMTEDTRLHSTSWHKKGVISFTRRVELYTHTTCNGYVCFYLCRHSIFGDDIIELIDDVVAEDILVDSILCNGQESLNEYERKYIAGFGIDLTEETA